MNITIPTKIFIGVMVLYCILIGRFFYFGYVKAPRELERLRSEGREADAIKWEEFRDKCKIRVAAISAIAVLSVIIFIS